MSPQRAALSQGRSNLVLATLFVGMFVMGSTELLVIGVLDLITNAARTLVVATTGVAVCLLAL